jgi:hypothetical protein
MLYNYAIHQLIQSSFSQSYNIGRLSSLKYKVIAFSRIFLISFDACCSSCDIAWGHDRYM